MAGIVHKIEGKFHTGGGEKKDEHKIEEGAKKHHQRAGGVESIMDKIKEKIHGRDGKHGDKKLGVRKKKNEEEEKKKHGEGHDGHSSSSDSD